MSDIDPSWYRILRDEKVPRKGRLVLNRVFVTNITPNITVTDLSEAMQVFGEVIEIRLMTSIRCRRRGYGFVTFEQNENAIKAINNVSIVIKGVKLIFGPAVIKSSSRRDTLEDKHPGIKIQRRSVRRGTSSNYMLFERAMKIPESSSTASRSCPNWPSTIEAPHRATLCDLTPLYSQAPARGLDTTHFIEIKPSRRSRSYLPVSISSRPQSNQVTLNNYRYTDCDANSDLENQFQAQQLDDLSCYSRNDVSRHDNYSRKIKVDTDIAHLMIPNIDPQAMHFNEHASTYSSGRSVIPRNAHWQHHSYYDPNIREDAGRYTCANIASADLLTPPSIQYLTSLGETLEQSLSKTRSEEPFHPQPELTPSGTQLYGFSRPINSRTLINNIIPSIDNFVISNDQYGLSHLVAPHQDTTVTDYVTATSDSLFTGESNGTNAHQFDSSPYFGVQGNNTGNFMLSNPTSAESFEPAWFIPNCLCNIVQPRTFQAADMFTAVHSTATERSPPHSDRLGSSMPLP